MQIKKKKISLKSLALIPARKGSKGLRRKNLLKINNKSLIEIAFEQAKKSKLITDLIFSTDSNTMMKLAKKNNVNVSKLRPQSLSNDNSNIFNVVEYETTNFEKLNNITYDFVILLQPTTPFRTQKIIDEAIVHFVKNYKKTDSLITITDVDYPINWSLKKKGKYVENLIKNGNQITRRQIAEKYFKPNGMVYIIKRAILKNLRNKILPTDKTLFFYVEKNVSINIDTKIDYLLAKTIYDEKKKNTHD